MTSHGLFAFGRRACAPLLAVTLAAGRSFANDAAAAQALFDEAKALMAADRWAEACPKLEGSLQLDPGVGTAFQLATCHEHVGRTATAWAEFLDAAQRARSAGQLARERVARQRAAALEARLSRLTVSPARDLPGLALTRDGREIGRGEWGTAVPVDPGAHTIIARAPGRVTWEQKVNVGPDAGAVEITVPPLAEVRFSPPAPPIAPSPATRRAVPDAALLASSPAEEHEARGRTRRALGFVLLGVGAAGIGVGALFGLFSKSKHDDAQNHCDAANRCDAEGLALRDDALRDGTISTVAFATGLAATAAGVVVLVTAPAGRAPRSGRIEAAPAFGLGTAGFTLRTAW